MIYKNYTYICKNTQQQLHKIKYTPNIMKWKIRNTNILWIHKLNIRHKINIQNENFQENYKIGKIKRLRLWHKCSEDETIPEQLSPFSLKQVIKAVCLYPINKTAIWSPTFLSRCPPATGTAEQTIKWEHWCNQSNPARLK